MSAGTRLGMVIDASRCVGCFNCHLACRDEHAGIDHRPVARAQPAAGASWIQVRLHERGSYPKVKVSRVPVPCLQCADAPCLRASTGGAVYRRDDGIVVIDPDKAVGQRQIAEACTYGAISWNEELKLAQKCTFCAHLLDDGWKEPRCVEACPTQALVFGDLNDPESEVSRLRARRGLQALEPRRGTAPPVLYSGLPSRFVAGEIAFADRPEEPARGVAVTLRGDDGPLGMLTDAYGDFEFTGLSPDSGYVLRVSQDGYETREVAIRGTGDVNVGAVVLQKRD